jgi:hypothetical protein
MIPSTSQDAERQKLRDYLLGKMPEDAAAGWDERLLEQNILVEQLEQEQQSLIEDFVGGRLSGEEVALFQLQLSRSPELRRKTDDFREFLQALERETSASKRAPGLSQLFLVLSPALAILLCIVSFLYVKELHRNGDLRSQLRTEPQTMQLPAQSFAGAPSLATAFLSANVPRASSAPLEIVIPPGTTTLELQIELHTPPSDAGGWKVEVLAGKEMLWQSTHTRVRRAGQEAFLTVFVSTEDLPAGQYAIRYSPLSDPGAIQTRPFVIRQGR